VLVGLAALALAGSAATGCGQSEEDKYVEDYKPLNDRLLRVGVAIGAAPLEAGEQTNDQPAQRFSKYAADLDAVKKDIADLDTPSDLEDESLALTSSLEVVVEDLKKVASAAESGDKAAAAAATRALARDAARVNFAQNKLARATGADAGPR
jgi:hypothetical protein